jgi:hypothetical protein
MSNLLRQVTLDRASRRKDKSVSLTFITSLEQTSEEFKCVDEMLDSTGVLYFKPNGKLTDQEVKELDGAELVIEGKSKSQRLRNVLYVYCQQKGYNDFKEFYATEMEKIILHYKSKLD